MKHKKVTQFGTKQSSTKQFQQGFIGVFMAVAAIIVLSSIAAGMRLANINAPGILGTTTQGKYIIPPTIENNDVQATVSGPIPNSPWDGAVLGELCFNIQPPTVNGKARVVLEMDVKDDSTGGTKSEIIGGSKYFNLTSFTGYCYAQNPTQLKFAADFNVPDPSKWVEECPEIRILAVTQGNWKPKPYEEIARIDASYLCPDGVPTTAPTQTPEAPPLPTFVAPSSAVVFRAITSTPSAPEYEDAITGRITVYSCEKPDDLELTVYDSSNQSGRQKIRLQDEQSEEGIWLDDDSGDRTYIYEYSIAKDSTGTILEEGDNIYFDKAIADIETFRRTNRDFESEEDDAKVTSPNTHDLTIDAQFLTCGCPFYARTFIKDADTGEILRIAREDLGVSNDILIQKFGDMLFQTFNNGVIDVRTDLFDYAERYKSNPELPFSEYGIDGIANIRLYAPGFEVVKQECISYGSIAACGGGSPYQYTTETTSKDIKGIRVACGVDVAYGWHVRNVDVRTDSDSSTIPEPSDLTHESLLDEREGYGKDTTGGQGGRVVMVTKTEDTNEEGTLRWAATLNEPVIIKFDIDGPIQLISDIRVKSNKTIDGRGENVVIEKYGLIMREVDNVIIHNIKIKTGAPEPICRQNENDGDAIGIIRSENIWIHHVTLDNYCDELISITKGSKNITISWSKMSNSKGILIGGSINHRDEDKNITVTLHHNFFNGVKQRTPRATFGTVDFYNNYIMHWANRATSATLDANMVAQNNLYEKGEDSITINGQINTVLTNYIYDDKVVAEENGIDDYKGDILTLDNVALNFNNDLVNSYDDVDLYDVRKYSINLDPPVEDLKTLLMSFAGALPPQSFSIASFSIINADLDRNGIVNAADLAVCIDEYSPTGGKSDTKLACDINIDNRVNALDYSLVTQFIGMTLENN